MKINTFAVEEWMNTYESDAVYNLAETCVDSLTLEELIGLDGSRVEDFFARLGTKKLTYGDIEGSERFRALVGDLYQARPEVLAMNGAIGANFLAFFTLVAPGDHVIAVHPTYQQLYDVPRTLGADVDLLPLRAQNGYLPDLDELRALMRPATKLIVLNNPNNPTGALIDEAMLREIAALADHHGAYVLCDEVYRDLLQEGVQPTASIVDIYERGISTGSMSKVLSLAGLRLGWVAGPHDAIDLCRRTRDYTTISCGMLDDALAVHALENRSRLMRRNLAIVRGNLQILDAWVQSVPDVSYVRPQAGTTALLHYGLDMPSQQFCEDLFRQTGVFFTPGSCFDIEGTVRIGYACAPRVLKDGLEETRAYIGRRARLGAQD